MPNIYYSPEDCGLEVVGHLEEENLHWEFHILGVWKDKESGKLFWTEDSGCSCPSPFEREHFNGADDTSLDSDIPELCDAILNFPAAQGDKDMLMGWIAEAHSKKEEKKEE